MTAQELIDRLKQAQDAWIVAQHDDGTRSLKRARWGLIPFWAKDAKIGNSLVNARSETVATKPAFRSAYKKRRCLVLADGFYEWQKREGGKQPIYIRMREGRQFAFGGLWERWREGEKEVETFCIIAQLVRRSAILLAFDPAFS